MEKIFFDNSTFIWKTKLNRLGDKSNFLKEANLIIQSQPNIKTDAFPYIKSNNEDTQEKLDEIVKISINYCKNLYKEKNIKYNKINHNAWINVVRSIKPVQLKYNQINGVNKFHIHTEIKEKSKSFIPDFTYVYYIQMPDIIENEDAVLYFKGENGQEYYILPEEDDLIIMPADMPHGPTNAPKSTIDRIVFAGNVGFDFIKNSKSIT